MRIGGHPLLATRVISRVKEVFEVRAAAESDLRGEDASPVLSRRVEEELRAGERVQVTPPIERVSRGARLPLSFAQQRLWFIEQPELWRRDVQQPDGHMRVEEQFRREALERVSMR